MDTGRAAGPGAGARPSRLELGVSLAVLAATLLTLPLLTHPWLVPGRDAVMYLETARSIAAGEGYAYLGQPFLVRPPGYALLLAPLVGLGEGTYRAIHLTNGVLGIAACAGLHLLARRRLPWGVSLLVALAAWTNPVVQRLVNQPMSDVAGLAALIGCLLLERRLARRPGWRGDLLLGVVIGLASYLRTGILLLVPAIAAARVVERLRRRSATPWRTLLVGGLVPLTLAAVAVTLPWSVRNARVAPPPPADQTLVYDYATGIRHEDAGDPGSPRLSALEIAARATRRVPEVAASVAARLDAGALGPVDVAFGLLALLALLAVAWRRGEPLELHALVLFAFLAFYFGYNRRLALPILAVALIDVPLVLGALGRRLGGARAGGLAAGLVPVLLIVGDARLRPGWHRIEAAHEAARAEARALQPHLADDARLATYDGFRYTAYLGRPVTSFCFALRRADEDDAVPHILEKYAVDTVLLSEAEPREQRLIPWFRRRHGPGESVGDVHLFRIR